MYTGYDFEDLEVSISRPCMQIGDRTLDSRDYDSVLVSSIDGERVKEEVIGWVIGCC